VLGAYVDSHSHELGNANLKFTRISAHAREQIAFFLRIGVEPRKIVRSFSHGLYKSETAATSAENDINSRKYTRDSMVTMSDILEIKRKLDAEKVRFHPDDAESI
ncbi:hypothetical protein SCHPADRAFT_809742, partial [Schizopora paradoxa]